MRSWCECLCYLSFLLVTTINIVHGFRLINQPYLRQVTDSTTRTTFLRLQAPGYREDKKKKEDDKGRTDYLILGLVPIIWGTYTPLVKDLYTAVSIPPPSLEFNLMSYMVSSFSFVIASVAIQSNKHLVDTPTKNNVPLIAGAELGIWLFAGSMTQVMGIQSTSSIKASILVQLTTVLVPVLESFISKRQLTSKLWLSSALAFTGVVLCSNHDPAVLLHPDSLSFGSGDLLVILSAVFYSMHVIRLGKYAANVDALQLAKSKALSELGLALITVITCIAIFHQEEHMQYFTSLFTDPMSTGWTILFPTVLWNGCIATALTMYCQSLGQQRIRPTEANLIYTSQPLWATIISCIFLHEQIDVQILPGMLLIVSAILVTVTGDRNRNSGSATSTTT